MDRSCCYLRPAKYLLVVAAEEAVDEEAVDEEARRELAA